MNFDGNIAENYNYDAWGRRRNPDTWEYTNVPEPTLIDFGYTSHEHWDKVNFINMTGRLYDPYLARFLNADPYVSEPQNSQALNRYTYVNNNPLIYNDPTGEVWQAAVYLGWKYLKTAHDNRDRETGKWDWDLETFRAKNGDWSAFFYFVGDATMNFNGGFNVEGSLNVNGMPIAGVILEPENTGIPQGERELASLIGLNAGGSAYIKSIEKYYSNKYNYELSKNWNQRKPYHININTGEQTWANPKILRNKRLTVRVGSGILFGINQTKTIVDYMENGNSTEFWDNTLINGLSGISPQMGALFLTYNAVEFGEILWDRFNNHPRVIQFQNDFMDAQDQWIMDLNRGYYR